MSAAAAAHPVAVLRRAALLVGVLAVIAGFLGMHIVAGSHGVHARPPSPGSIQTSTAPHAAGQADADPTAGHPAGHSTGHPSGHSSHSAAGTFPQAYDGPAAARTAPSVTLAAATSGGSQVPPSCACQGGCAETPAAHIDCTPFPAGATLSAPQPGTTLLEAPPWSAARADRLSGYAYRPGTPTPRDLSISRT